MKAQTLESKSYQQEALKRLREKRQKDGVEKAPSAIHKRAEQREKWESALRGKREKLVEEQVDLDLLKGAIEIHPHLLMMSRDALVNICSELLMGIRAKDLQSIEHDEQLAVLSKAAEPIADKTEVLADDKPKDSLRVSFDATSGMEGGAFADPGKDEDLPLIKSVSVSGASAADIESLLSNASSDQSQTLSPQVLFSTILWEEKLKNFHAQLCFPTNVDVTIKVDKSSIVETASPSATLKMSRASIRQRTGSISGSQAISSKRRRSSGQMAAEAGDRRFVTRLANEKANVSYGINFVMKRSFRNKNTGVSVTTEYCIYIISDHPLFSVFFHICDVFVAMGGFDLLGGPLEQQESGMPVSSDLRALNDLARKLLKYSLPRSPSKPLEVNIGVSGSRQIVSVFRLDKIFENLEKEMAIHNLLWSLPILLRTVPLDQLILIIGCALAEMNIIVLSQDSTTTSGCILALVTLLRPLKWTGNVFTVVPQDMSEFLADSIGCNIIGLSNYPQGFVRQRGTVTINAKENTVDMSNEDVVLSLSLLPPQPEKLNNRLKPMYSTILNLTKAKYYTRPRTGSETLIPEPLRRTSSFEALSLQRETHSPSLLIQPLSLDPSGIRAMPPFPIELDVTHEAYSSLTSSSIRDNSSSSRPGDILLDAISTFANIMEDHLKMVIKMTISIALDEKHQKGAAKRLQVSKLPVPNHIETNSVDRSRSNSDSSGDLSALRSPSFDIDESLFSVEGFASIKTSTPKGLSSIQSGGRSSVLYPPVLPRPNSIKQIDRELHAFVNRFRKTQMFCLYCEVESNRKRQKNDQTLEPSDINSLMTKIQHKKGWVSDEFLITDNARILPFEKRSTNKDDPLVAVISIILTGTIPLPADDIESLNETFLHISKSANSTFSVRDSMPIENPISEILWCNGRCMGRTDTPTCTLLCLSLWEKRLKSAHHQIVLKDIVDRHHYSHLVMRPIKYKESDGDKLLSSDLALDNHLLPSDVIIIKPSHDIKKHPRETGEQYNLRRQIVKDDNSIEKHKENVARKRIKMLSKMFDNRKKRKGKLITISSLLILRKFLRFFVRSYRAMMKEQSAIKISAIVRGYLLRIRLPDLKEQALVKVGRKCFSIIKIRNFLRQRARELCLSPWYTQKSEGCRGVFLAFVANLHDKKAKVGVQLQLQQAMTVKVPTAAKPRKGNNSLVSTDSDKDRRGSITNRLFGSMFQHAQRSEDVQELPSVPRVTNRDVSSVSRDNGKVRDASAQRDLPLVDNGTKLHTNINSGVESNGVSPTAATSLVSLFPSVNEMPSHETVSENTATIMPVTSSSSNIIKDRKNPSPPPVVAHRDKSPLEVLKDSHCVTSQDKISATTYLQRAELKEKLAAAKAKSPQPKTGKPAGKDREISPIASLVLAVENKLSQTKVLQHLPKLPAEDKDKDKGKTSLSIPPIPPPPRDSTAVSFQTQSQSVLRTQSGNEHGEHSSLTVYPSFSSQASIPGQNVSTDHTSQAAVLSVNPGSSALSIVPMTNTAIVSSPVDSTETLSKTFHFGGKHEETEEEWLKPQNSSSVPIPEKRKSIFAKMGDWFTGQEQISNAPSERVRSMSVNLAGLSHHADKLLPQQQKLIRDMGLHLISGVAIVKHGRHGHPKDRYLYCDSIISKLYWSEKANHPVPEDLTMTVESVLKQEELAKRPRRRLTFLKGEADREILFRDILEVRDDIQTEVMIRSYENKSFKDADSNMKLISIITSDRSLDFEICEKDHDIIYRALQVIVQCYRGFGSYNIKDF